MSDSIPRLSFEELPPELVALLESRVKRLGYLGEFFQCFGHQPGALLHFQKFNELASRGHNCKPELERLVHELGHEKAVSVMFVMARYYAHALLVNSLGLRAPVIITKEQIDAEIERLAGLELPENGRRRSLIVHPAAAAGTPGLAPGIQVSLNVLKPSESTAAYRHNATEVNFCVRGSGVSTIGDQEIEFAQYDVWNTPSWNIYSHRNTGDDLLVMLNYSNAPLLKFMQILIAEENPALPSPGSAAVEDEAINPRRNSPYGTFELTSDGAMLMPYEKLINPPLVESKSLKWPWSDVESELKKLEDLGKDYVGRRLYLLYNPITGRTNGTTPNFFATITIRPPNIIDRPHRHTSASINYFFHGSGRSSVAGNVYEWKAGDLMLSAPGWAVHNHASYDDCVYELTIQDQPLTIAMESLLWQENLKEDPALLGTQMGFDTNRD